MFLKRLKSLPKKLFRKNKIVVYTAIFGNKDNLRVPLHKIKNADLICFSDKHISSESFRVIVREPTHTDPNRSAKKYKLIGDEVIEEYDYSIWVDANMLVKFDDAQKLIDDNLQDADIALFAHPDGRDCIYDECEFLIQHNSEFNFDDPARMTAHIERYRQEGFPAHKGLVAGGFIVRKVHSPSAKAIGRLWWEEVQKGSRRDQLSFNYVIWKLKENYGVIPGVYWDNDYMKVETHIKPSSLPNYLLPISLTS